MYVSRSLSLQQYSIFSILVFPVLNAFDGLCQASIVPSKYLYVYLCQTLIRLLFLYQLVFLVFVYLCLVLCTSNVYVHENLYQMFAGLFLYISQCCPCLFMSLSIQRSPELSFYYCFQRFSLSLFNSVADYRLSPSL